MSSDTQVTQLLMDWRNGDEKAINIDNATQDAWRHALEAVSRAMKAGVA